MAAFKKWFNNLLGRPTLSTPPVPEEKPKEGEEDILSHTRVDVTPPENSLQTDVVTLKTVAEKVSNKLKEAMRPFVRQGEKSSKKAADSVGKVVDVGFMRKLVKIFMTILCVMIIIFVAVRLFRVLREESQESETIQPTPTTFIYIPPRSSIYAGDPSILKMEEDLNVLTREVSNSIIRETTLNPPNLDFNVSF